MPINGQGVLESSTRCCNKWTWLTLSVDMQVFLTWTKTWHGMNVLEVLCVYIRADGFHVWVGWSCVNSLPEV